MRQIRGAQRNPANELGEQFSDAILAPPTAEDWPSHEQLGALFNELPKVVERIEYPEGRLRNMGVIGR